ncbi:flavodoxin FldB [Thorsellia kenyensis]|uniref:Flavodoxin n=1 Tax=Thorsellia kenyensis TaxID=1549888 RepID=A0ABV6C814_9GAMM
MRDGSTLFSVGIFYGSSTCYTEIAAEKIAHEIEKTLKNKDLKENFSVSIFNTKETPLQKIEEFDCLILGISTWDFGEIQEDWLKQWHEIGNLKLDNKIVSLFGLGDQEGYGNWFLDAMGLLYNQLNQFVIHWCGFWPTDGYNFTSVLPITEDKQLFVGLALDDDSQYELTDQRIEKWSEQVVSEWLDILA